MLPNSAKVLAKMIVLIAKKNVDYLVNIQNAQKNVVLNATKKHVMKSVI